MENTVRGGSQIPVIFYVILSVIVVAFQYACNLLSYS